MSSPQLWYREQILKTFWQHMPQKFPSLTRLTPPNNVYLGWSNLYLGLLLHGWWMRHGWWGQHTKTGNRVLSVYFKDVIKHQWKLTTSGSYSSKVGTNHTFFISGDHQVCSLEKSLEMLGSSKMLFFCLLSTTDAGLWIALPKEASLTWQLAPSATRPKKIFNTSSSPHVSLQGGSAPWSSRN